MTFKNLKNYFKWCFFHFISYIAGKHLKILSARSKSFNSLVDLAFYYKFPSLKIVYPTPNLILFQKRKEFKAFCKIIRQNRPEIVIEIGTARGGTLFLLSRISLNYSTIISIDLPTSTFAEKINSRQDIFFKSFALSNQTVEIIKGNSHHRETLNKVKTILQGRQVDLLFIDGDHTYEGVKKDFQMYSPLVKDDGIIAFHDIVEVSDENVEVNRFWNEIKENFYHKEIVEDWNQGNCGIGIIFNKK
jgi:predicted O-methyltransferase YrrM